MGTCLILERVLQTTGTSIVRGWGELAFARHVSLPNKVGHVIAHGLLDDDQPGAIVRTTEHRTIVIVIAGASGRPFGT